MASTSCGKVCVKPFKVAVTLLTSRLLEPLVKPATWMTDGYGTAGPESGIRMLPEFVKEAVNGIMKLKVTRGKVVLLPSLKANAALMVAPGVPVPTNVNGAEAEPPGAMLPK